ncbi:hypothetical protein [uncultured Rhodoblastus sp.]|uniref:hypothetical protein n=1 Tax=uncultured Rhodoblastus sp. TaxID=543037 RepID=UPI0025D18ECC|nr:hypothetical protein [uncultured Rhodoblastus sp.]
MARQQEAAPSPASPLPARCLPLACLDETGMENFLRFWRGASGRRYICSVYAIGAPPVFDCARSVVAAVRQEADGAKILFAFQPGPEAERDGLRLWTEQARREGADEWHVHLLAGSPEARESALRDLACAA